eukprot:GDKJ01013183.1.p1 GENE.GDKJ01013183.1~~GDKJ01013183.1.p1  ORF type:complete len:350 (+),score=65.92 GDKJ01013183.1:104-1051(+)
MKTNELPAMCEKCAEAMLMAMDDELHQLNEDIVEYRSVLKNLNDDEKNYSNDQLLLKNELKHLDDEHTILMNKLVSVESDIKNIEKQIKEEDLKALEVNYSLEKLFKDWNNHVSTLRRQTDIYSQSVALNLYARNRIRSLKSFNVINDSFFISVDRSFGTIGGLRMGRTTEGSVGQFELSAAWGLVALLIDVICNKCNFNLQVRPIARGSNSFIKVADGTCYPLFPGDRGLSKLFGWNRYDQGMQAVLTAVKELETWVQKIDGSVKLPFRIDAGKIEGLSLTSKGGTGESSTKAMKFLLVNLKYLIAFVESRCSR